jgi:hypothetical protein
MQTSDVQRGESVQHREGDLWRMVGDPFRVWEFAFIQDGEAWLKSDWHSSYRGIKVWRIWNELEFVRLAKA